MDGKIQTASEPPAFTDRIKSALKPLSEISRGKAPRVVAPRVVAPTERELNREWSAFIKEWAEAQIKKIDAYFEAHGEVYHGPVYDSLSEGGKT